MRLYNMLCAYNKQQKESLAEIDKDSEIWLADAEDYFHGMEGEF